MKVMLLNRCAQTNSVWLSRDVSEGYAVTNTRSSMAPFLTYSTERDLREAVWSKYYARGDNGDAFDNNAIIAEILQLRDERVGLLGYDNYAQWRLGNRMAGTPERALELMEAVWPAAIARVAEEVADMQAVADAEGADFKIAPWDYRYYAEKVRKAKYDLDSDEVKQYLQLDKLTDAMFYVAGELFNFKFTPVPEGSVPVFHEDVGVWEVTDKTSGEHVGLWYLDPFARQGKRSGAWATSYRSHTTFDGPKTVLSSNNSNFIKGAPGEAVLISWDDANTFFHEFGHALHSLSSNVVYGIDPDSFERETLIELNMPEEIVMRHRSPHFGHIFSGEGYSAGYYGYMWADVLTSDAAESFKQAPGGFYDPEVADRLVKYLFAPRNAMDPAEAFRKFKGRDADISALLRDRGFPVPE